MKLIDFSEVYQQSIANLEIQKSWWGKICKSNLHNDDTYYQYHGA
jgi:hypothetical protein